MCTNSTQPLVVKIVKLLFYLCVLFTSVLFTDSLSYHTKKANPAKCIPYLKFSKNNWNNFFLFYVYYIPQFPSYGNYNDDGDDGDDDHDHKDDCIYLVIMNFGEEDKKSAGTKLE